MSRYKYRMGCIKDSRDDRDLTFSIQFRLPDTLPAAVDLKPGCSPIENQLSLGSCTYNAIVGAL